MDFKYHCEQNRFGAKMEGMNTGVQDEQVFENVNSIIKALCRNRRSLISDKVSEAASKVLPQKMSYAQRVKLRSRDFSAK